MRFEAVLFDMDGTLLDSERLMIEAGLRAFEAMGLPQRRDVLMSLVGTVNAESEALLVQAFGDGFDMAELDGHWGREVKVAYADGIPLKPGARDVLQHLTEAGVPFALATNSRTWTARENLADAGIDHFFAPEHTFGRDRVTRPKPAPDLFVAAAEALGVAAGACVVFEKSGAGVRGALAAGAHVIHVPDLGADPIDTAHETAPDLMTGARMAGLL